jgi:hypothetical protein
MPGKDWSAAIDVRYDALADLPNTIVNSDQTFGTSSTFSQQKTAALLSVAGSLFSGLWVGTNIKAYSESIDNDSAHATGIDVGLLWAPVSNLFFGWSRSDVGDTKKTWSTQKVDIKLASDLFSVTWVNPDASLSYLASPDSPHLIRGQFRVFDGVWLGATVPVNNPQDLDVQVDLKLAPLTLRYTTSFSELNNRQSQLTFGWSLGE